jgi:hypothetical protein
MKKVKKMRSLKLKKLMKKNFKMQEYEIIKMMS